MTAQVIPHYVLEGAAYALEQCGLLLRDANFLYRNRSYASTIALTAFAREELGRSRILLDLWRKASAGDALTIEQLEQACDDHLTKQKAGMLSLILKADRESGVGKVLEARMKSDPQSPESQEAEAELKLIEEAMKKRTPGNRHQKRMAALYVEPVSETEWSRPSATSASAAHDFLQHAVSDYSTRYYQGYITSASSIAILKQTDPNLYNALEQWSDRPVLQPPEWP
jgi:AbiV family abortive infection protein